MTTANKITIGRIVLVPFFVVQILYYAKAGADLHRLLALGAFLLACLSDWLDGYLARHRGQHTELGAVLDPLADKLLSMAALVLLSLPLAWDLTRLPLWLAGTVIGRDLILILGWLVVRPFHSGIEIRPRLIGKIGTVLLMACVVSVLLQGPAQITWFMALAAAVCDGISGILYISDGLRQMHGHPAVAPVEQKSGKD
jgi:CDP-diacylglycerol--glycerol-3-phosphate 3-phosphatidyltransferase